MSKVQSKLFFACFLAFVFVLSGLLVNSYLYIGLIITVAFYLVTGDKKEHVFPLLLFIMPFSYITKLSPNSTSLFTVAVLLVCIWLTITASRKISGGLLVVYLVFIVYSIVVEFNFSINIIKIILNTYLVYLFIKLYDEKQISNCVLYYTNGLLLSCVVSFVFMHHPNYLAYYGSYDYIWFLGTRIQRFPGIFGDPNYLSIALIMCINVLMVVYAKGKSITGFVSHKIYLLASVSLCVIIGFFTFSKSFYFMLVVLLVMNLVFSSQKKKTGLYSILIILAAFVVIYNPHGILDMFLSRFQTQQLLTGRDTIWQEYLHAINSSLATVLFGHGLSMEYVELGAAHNMYLQAVYLLGLVGTLLYFGMYFGIFFLTRKRSVDYRKAHVVLQLSVMYFFLNGLTAFEYPFYLIICYICCYKEK